MGILFRWWWLWVIGNGGHCIGEIWWNKQKYQQKTFIYECKYCTESLFELVLYQWRHPIWSDLIPSDLIWFDSSPKSLSSAQTLPYHTGFPGDSSECKDDNIMKYNFNCWLLLISGVFAVDEIFFTNCEPRFHHNPISFITGICKQIHMRINSDDACALRHRHFEVNAWFRAGLTC